MALDIKKKSWCSAPESLVFTAGSVSLEKNLGLPQGAEEIVIFAHGIGLMFSAPETLSSLMINLGIIN